MRIRTASLLEIISLAVAVLHAPHLSAEPRAVQSYLRLPLAFERDGNGAEERFVARGPGYTVGVQRGAATIGLALKKEGAASIVSLEFVRSQSTKAEPGPQLPGKVNYIHGNDPKRWRIGLPTWERVRYSDIYPGIDVVYYGNQQQLEFDLVLKPGADPQAIRMKIGGGSKLSLDDSGALRIETAGADDLKIELPNIYQEVDGKKKSVSGRYAIQGRDEVAFQVDSYDRARPLVIDPTIVYSTLFGGTGTSSSSIGLDSSGNILLAGSTSQPDFPIINATQNELKGSTDGFVAKINSAGTALVYSTYLGGSSNDGFASLAVDSAGAAWLTGSTTSLDFPVMNAPAFPGLIGSGLAVVVKLDENGAPQFSSYLGTGQVFTTGTGIAVDGSGSAYVTGWTEGTFPATPGTLQPPISFSPRTFVTKYSSGGSIVSSALLGGDGSDQGYAIAVDSIGDAYVTGSSTSTTITGAPAGGAQPVNNGGGDAFVAKWNADATALFYFTFLGGSALDQGNAIAVDSAGNAYIAGYTNSAGLATPGAAQTSSAGPTTGFVAKLNAGGSAFGYITYIGGNRYDTVTAMALDSSGNVYVAGNTDSENFPVVNPLQATLPLNGTSLFRSTDSGATWAAFDSNIPGVVYGISANPAGSSAVVATGSGIYRTIDAGMSWTQQSSVVFYATDLLNRSPVSPGTIYALVCCSSVYRSSDDGVTWSLVGSLPVQPFGLLADPLDASIVYAFGEETSAAIRLFKSVDGGATWTAADLGPRNLVATSDGALYSAGSGGVYRSTDQASSWTPVNDGLPATAFTSLFSLSASATTVYLDVYAGYSDTIYKSTSESPVWTATSPAVNPVQIAASPQSPSIVYALSEQNTVQQSTDGGATWNSPGAQLPQIFMVYGGGLSVDPANSTHLFAVAGIDQSTFVSKLNSAGSALSWSTYLGGSASPFAYGMATNGQGSVFVTGAALREGHPITSSALPSGPGGIFVTEISDATASCSLTINPGNATAYQYSQTFTFSVAAPSGCPWTASTNNSWAVITSGVSGTGTGLITVQVSDDTDSSSQERVAVLTVGNENITITQAGGSCTFALDQSRYSAPGAGGALSVVLTAPAGCPWSLANNYPSAITITSGVSGTGSATIRLNLTPNPTAGYRDFYLLIGSAQIEIDQAPAFAPRPLQLIMLAPCRVMDTRNSGGPFGGPFIAGGTSRTIPITTSSCGVPPDAAAYALNVTVVPRTGTLGYLTVWSTGQPQPPVSTLNSLDGAIVANAAIVRAGYPGSIDAFATDDTDLIVDINGYFEPPVTGELQLYPLAPCRVLDTRNPEGALGGPSLVAGIGRSFPIGSSSCGVAVNAAAWSLNVTVVPHGILGYLTTWPTGQPQPLASTLNSLDGTILANAAIVQAGVGGAVTFVGSNDTDLVVDINGYFAPASYGGLNFYPATPCRLVDTRNPDGTFGGPVIEGQTARSFRLEDSACELPSTAQAYSLNMTVVPQAPILGYLSAWPAGGTQPVVSTLNALKGQVVANAAIVPAGAGGAIDVFVTDTAHVVIDTNGYFGQ